LASAAARPGLGWPDRVIAAGIVRAPRGSTAHGFPARGTVHLMSLLYGYDWSRRQGKIVTGEGPTSGWSRDYAEAVLAGEEDGAVVSVFTAAEAPLTQVRISSQGLGFAVLWINESGRSEFEYLFEAQVSGFNDRVFSAGAAVREGELFLRNVTKKVFGTPERAGVTCQRRFRTDGSVQESYAWDFFDRAPDVDSGEWDVDSSVDMLGDGFWHGPLTSLGFEDLESLLVRDRPGVNTSFDLPTHPDDR